MQEQELLFPISQLISSVNLTDLKTLVQVASDPLVELAFLEGPSAVQELFGMSLFTVEDYLKREYSVTFGNMPGCFRLYASGKMSLCEIVDDAWMTVSTCFVERLGERFAPYLDVAYAVKGAGYRPSIETMYGSFARTEFPAYLVAMEKARWSEAAGLRAAWDAVSDTPPLDECTGTQIRGWGIFFNILSRLLSSRRRDKTPPELKAAVVPPTDAITLAAAIMSRVAVKAPVKPNRGPAFTEHDGPYVDAFLAANEGYELVKFPQKEGEAEYLMPTALDLFQLIGSHFVAPPDTPDLKDACQPSGSVASVSAPMGSARPQIQLPHEVQPPRELSLSAGGPFATVESLYAGYCHVTNINTHKPILKKWKDGGLTPEGESFKSRYYSKGKMERFQSHIPIGEHTTEDLVEIFAKLWDVPPEEHTGLADFILANVFLRKANLGHISLRRDGSLLINRKD